MVWRFLGIGWYIALCLFLGALVGWKLDERFDTAPWLALTGVTSGFFLALLGFYLMVRSLLKEEEQKDNEKKE
jgi:F0F1-type ATP synthase assembly protein I